MEGFNPEEFSKILDLLDHIVPTVLMTIGIANDEPKPKVRLKKEEMFF